MYRCFKRTWWIDNPEWPDGLEPHAGKKSYPRNARFETIDEARNFCTDYNSKHEAGRYSLKMEFEEVTL